MSELDLPRQPIRSNTHGMVFVPVSFPIQCENCRNSFDVRVPSNETESNWNLYGDEAGREIDQPVPEVSISPLDFRCLSLVGLRNSRQLEFDEQLSQLKRTCRPKKEPRDWKLHFKEIWGANQGNKKFDFAGVQEKIDFGHSVASLIDRFRPDLYSINVSGCTIRPDTKAKRRQQLQTMKEEIFVSTLLHSLKHLRENNKAPRWIFDNIKDATTAKRSEGWAEELFLGLQYTPIFTWLSSGAYIEPPKFVAPGSSPMLEIADFISFVVAREFQQLCLGLEVEIPSGRLGKMMYVGFLGEGSNLAKSSKGLPAQEFFGLKPAH